MLTDSKFPLGRPRARSHNFFAAPEAFQGGSKRAPGTFWEQGRRPRAAQEPTGRHFGSNSDPAGVHFSGFEGFGGHLWATGGVQE